MVNWLIFGILAVFVSSEVDCRYWTESRHSTTSGDGYTNTITETDDNGKKEVIQSRFGPDGTQEIMKNHGSFGSDGRQHSGFGFDDSRNSIQPISAVTIPKIQPFNQDAEIFNQRFQPFNTHVKQPEFPNYSNFPTIGFPTMPPFAPSNQQPIDMQQMVDHWNTIQKQIELEFKQREQDFLNGRKNTFPINNQISSFQQNSNDPYSTHYGVHSSSFSKSSNINGVEDHKEGATTTINDNGRTATYSIGDKQ